MSRKRTVTAWIVLALVLVAAAVGRLCIGSSGLGWPVGELAAVYRADRWLHLQLAAVVGVALAVSGVALQTLLRNPLAEPFILGLSTGAGVGVMAQRALYHLRGVAFGPGYLGAALGALASMLVVFFASRRRGLIDPLGLLLTGVVLSTLNGAVILLLNYTAGPGGLRNELANWMMGYLDTTVSSATLATVAAVTTAGLLLLLGLARAMDVATLPDAEARSLGVNLARLRVVLFAVSALLAAGAVVLAGPVAFVGLICPHVARTCLGPAHRPLLLGAAVCGAALVILADTAGALLQFTRNVGVAPVGIFTALVGGPVFLWMLHPRLGRGQD